MADPDQLPWDIGYVVDEDLRCTGFGVLRGPVRHSHYLKQLAELAEDHHIIGMTCWGVFPMIGNLDGNLPDEEGLINGHDEPYMEFIEGWTHCFRHPDAYLPRGVPRTLFSNSDNLDPDRIWKLATESGPMEKKWDFFYTCVSNKHSAIRKNWELAKTCSLRFAEELGLRGVLVGVEGFDDVPQHPNLDTFPEVGWREFLQILGQSRVAFFPNTWDPSPRVIAEALCLDIPIVTNEDILGGWQYISPVTGRSFTDEGSAVEAMALVQSADVWPREWYMTHYGRRNAGPRLAEFLRTVTNGEDATSSLRTARFYHPRDFGGAPPK